MRSAALVVIALALMAAACTHSTGRSAPSGATSHAVTPASVSASPVTVPTPQGDVQLPSDAGATVDDPADGATIFTIDKAPFAPPGSSFTASVLVAPVDPLDQITIRWLDGVPPERSVGLTVWQRFDEEPNWRVVYAFTDGRRKGAFGVDTEEGDLTGDGIPDTLSFEDLGGSGACGTYRVISSTPGDAREIFRRDTCDTEITIASGGLKVREAVYELGDPHCCPSAFRTSVVRWNGEHWETVSSELEPAA